MKPGEDSEKSEMNEEEMLKQTLLSKAQISILLNGYEDIFSSFDPRPYTHRALSDDFLIESKKATMDKQGALELSFLIPKAKRNFEHELVIKKRLRDHFGKHAVMISNEISRIKRRGILMAFLGVIFILIASFLYSKSSESWFIHFLIVILEPAGWFTAWTGLDEIYYTTRQKKPDLEFYQKMTKVDITFHTY